MSKTRYIKTLRELDQELEKVDRAFAISDDEGRHTLAQFTFVMEDNLPSDPYSPQYHAAQMQRYYAIAGRNSYVPSQNERTEFDFDRIKNNPFPYSTQSPVTVGDQLIAQGFLIRAMNLRPKTRVVEFGAGWGNTTAHLVQIGYDVTVVEIDPAFVELLNYRVGLFGKPINIIQADMLDFKSTQPYDAALFFESFHHCSDHLRLLDNLREIVSDDGIIAFAAEPITEFPFPWGLRLDGMSVWSTRKFGWLELGFDTSYFLRTLLFRGWIPQRFQSGIAQWTDVIIARKSKSIYLPGEITLPPDEDATWAPRETAPDLKMRFSSGKTIMSCARSPVPQSVEFCLSNYAPFELRATLQAGDVSTTVSLAPHSPPATYTVPVQNWQGRIMIQSPTWNPAKVVKNGDNRELGVAVHHIRLLTGNR